MCQKKTENSKLDFSLVFTDSKRKFEKFTNEKLSQEKEFLDDLRKKAKERLDKIKTKG